MSDAASLVEILRRDRAIVIAALATSPIQSTFMMPPTNSSPINAQQQPTRCAARARMPAMGRAGCQGRRGARRPRRVMARDLAS
jgi:hypothetical protein